MGGGRPRLGGRLGSGGEGIVSTPREGLAAQHTPKGQERPSQEAALVKCLHTVCATSGMETTGRWGKARQEAAVETHGGARESPRQRGPAERLVRPAHGADPWDPVPAAACFSSSLR